MADHGLPPPPAPVAAPAVEHAAVEPPLAVEELPAIEPAVTPQPNPPPAPVLEADPAPAVGTVEEAAARIKVLEDKIKSLELLKTLESSESALAALRRHISRPTAMFDKYEALDLPQSLVRLARNESHKKADEYAAALDEIRARTDALDLSHLQRLFSRVIGGSCSP